MFAAIAAVVAFVAFVTAVAFAMASPELCLDSLVWIFYPNNPANASDHAIHMINVDIATTMFNGLPTLVLVDMLLSTRTYLAKLLFIVSWVTSLFVLEEMFYVELLHPDVFAAVLALSAMYLLALLRIPSIIKIVSLLILRIVGICLRTFSHATVLLVKCLIYWIIAPLVLQMLAKDCLRVMSNCNLPTLGLVVNVSAILLYGFGLLLQLAFRLFHAFTDAMAAYGDTLPLPAEEPDYTAGLPEAPPSVGWLCDVSAVFVPLHCEGRGGWPAIRASVDDNYAMYWNAQGAFKDLVTIYNSFKRDHPLRFRSYSNYEKLLKECRLYELGSDMVILEMKLRGEFRCTPLLRKVKRTWEEAEFDHSEMIEEAAVEPVARAREEADATPQLQEQSRVEVEAPVEDSAEEEPVVFDQWDAEEEEGGMEVPAPKKRRRRREVALLNSELGDYWSSPPSRHRRGARARRNSGK